MTSLPSLTLVARIILSVQSRRVGAEEQQPANSDGLASFLGVPGETRRRRFQARGNRRSLPARGRSPPIAASRKPLVIRPARILGRWAKPSAGMQLDKTRAPAPTSQSCLIDPALPGYGRPLHRGRYRRWGREQVPAPKFEASWEMHSVNRRWMHALGRLDIRPAGTALGRPQCEVLGAPANCVPLIW